MQNRALAYWIDSLIPHAIWRSTPVPATVARARTLVAIQAMAVVLPLLMLVPVVIMQWITGRNFTPAWVSLLCIVVLFALQLLLLHKSSSLALSSALFSLSFFFTIATATVLTGAWRSPVLPLLFCTPLMVFLVCSWREAEYAVLVTFAAGMVLMVMDIAGVSVPNVMHAENFAYAQGVVWFLACTVLVLLLGTQKWVHGLKDAQYLRG